MQLFGSRLRTSGWKPSTCKGAFQEGRARHLLDTLNIKNIRPGYVSDNIDETAPSAGNKSARPRPYIDIHLFMTGRG